MKKIVLIAVALILSMAGYSQSTFKKGIQVGADQVVIDSIVEASNGILYVYVGGVATPMYSSSDETGPVIDSVVTSGSLSIIVHYNETISADQSDTDNFDIQKNGESVGFEAMAIGTSTLTFTMADTIRPGNILYLSYTYSAGGVTDIYGNEANTTTESVVNKAPDPATPTLIASWGFNNSYLDDSASYTLTRSAGVGFADFAAAEGTRAVDLDGTNHYMHTNTAVNLTDDFSIFFTWLSWLQIDYPACILSNRDADGGIEIYANGAGGYIEARTFNSSGDSVVAKSNYALARGKWNSVGITGDKTAGEIHFWINGNDEDSDTLARTDFAVNDTIYMGADLDNEFKAFGYFDWLRPYDGKLTGANFRNLHEAINLDPYIDTVAPSPDTANVTSTTLQISFTEELANTSLDLTSFTYTEGGVEKTLSSPVINGANITFTVPEPAGGAALVCRYDSSGNADLRDSYYNYVDTFYLDVSNRIASGVTLLAHYKMDNDATDASDNGYDAAVNSTNYSSTIKAAGSHSFTAAGIGNVTPLLGLDSTFTISAWVYRSSGITFTDYLSQRVENYSNTDGGFELSYDFTNGHPFVGIETAGGSLTTINGSVASPATSTSEWIHVVLEVDLWADTLAFWVNGTFTSGNHSITVLPPIAKKWTLGRGRSTLDGYLDDVQFYDSLATDSQILFLYNNPGEEIGGKLDPPCPCGGVPGDCDPCPTDNDFDVYWTANFDHWATDASLPVMYNTGSNERTDAIEEFGGPSPNPMWGEDFFGKSPLRDSDQALRWSWKNISDPSNPVYIPGTIYSNLPSPPIYDRDYYDSIVYDPLHNSPALKISQAEDRVNSYFGEAAWVYPDDNLADYDELWFGFNIMWMPEFEPNRTDYDNAGGGKMLGYGLGNPVDFQPLRLPEWVSAEKGYTIGAAGRVMWDSGGFNTYSNYFNNPEYDRLRVLVANGTVQPDVYAVPEKVEWDEFQPSGDTCDNGGAVNKPFKYVGGDNFIPRWDEAEPRWYNVVYHLVKNTSTNENGVIEGFVNGYLIHQIDDVRWFQNAAENQEGWNRFRIAAFMGGNDLNLSAPKDSWWLIDDIWYGVPKSGHGNPGINEGSTCNGGTYLNLPNWPKRDSP